MIKMSKKAAEKAEKQREQAALAELAAVAEQIKLQERKEYEKRMLELKEQERREREEREKELERQKEAERKERERREAQEKKEREERERLERERKERERREKEEREAIEKKEREERERRERERREQEKKEREEREAAQREAERLEKEKRRIAKEERRKAEEELERQRQIKEAEQRERERLEKIEAERLEKIRKEKEKQERLEQYRREKLAKEEQERREAEIKERERREKEEREAREAAEKERLKQERLAREAFERDLREKERQKKKLTKFLDRVTAQCLQKQICTYVGTGNMASMQFMYVCMTCKKIDICDICQSFGCHAGHDVYVKVTDLDEKRTQLKRESWCACSQNGHECKRTQEGPIMSPRVHQQMIERASAGDSDSSEPPKPTEETPRSGFGRSESVNVSAKLSTDSAHTRPTGSPAPRANFFTNRGESARVLDSNPSPRTRNDDKTDTPPEPTSGGRLNLAHNRSSNNNFRAGSNRTTVEESPMSKLQRQLDASKEAEVDEEAEATRVMRANNSTTDVGERKDSSNTSKHRRPLVQVQGK